MLGEACASIYVTVGTHTHMDVDTSIYTHIISYLNSTAAVLGPAHVGGLALLGLTIIIFAPCWSPPPNNQSRKESRGWLWWCTKRRRMQRVSSRTCIIPREAVLSWHPSSWERSLERAEQSPRLIHSADRFSAGKKGKIWQFSAAFEGLLIFLFCLGGGRC